MTTEKELRRRISETKTKFSWSENSLANGDKATQKRLNRQLSHDAALTADTLLLILDAFDISAEWLMRGEGDMLRTRTQETPTLLTDQIERLREENEILRDEIIRLHLEMGKQRQDNQKVAG